MTISEYQKYPTDKKKFDRNWIKIFGVKCKRCRGSGWLPEYDPELGAEQGVEYICPKCKGIGKIERENNV